jgi:hypothetical protein
VPSTRVRVSAAAAVAALAVLPLLGGCSSADEATGTAIQTQASGNGASANVGDIALRGVTIVKGAAGLPVGTVIGTLVNSGGEPDVLTGVSVTNPSGATATITGGATGSLQLPAQSRVQIGQETNVAAGLNGGVNLPVHVDLTSFTIAPSAFATLVFTFQKAGTVTVPTMAVLPDGIYAGYGPLSS